MSDWIALYLKFGSYVAVFLIGGLDAKFGPISLWTMAKGIVFVAIFWPAVLFIAVRKDPTQ